MVGLGLGSRFNTAVCIACCRRGPPQRSSSGGSNDFMRSRTCQVIALVLFALLAFYLLGSLEPSQSNGGGGVPTCTFLSRLSLCHLILCFDLLCLQLISENCTKYVSSRPPTRSDKSYRCFLCFAFPFLPHEAPKV